MLNVALDNCGKSSCRMFIVYGCHLSSNFVILLNVVFESPVGLRLTLIRGSRGSASCTVLMLFTDLVVRHLPDFSVFQFLLVPCVEYFAKFLRIVLVHAWRLSVWKSFFKTLNYPLWKSSRIVL